ncbi:MAG: hypothetical protein ACOX54_08310 [Christensenellales bacterium]
MQKRLAIIVQVMYNTQAVFLGRRDRLPPRPGRVIIADQPVNQATGSAKAAGRGC